MKMEKTCVVRSEAGRDKGDWFFVLGTQGEYLLLADGKRRKITSPKRKKRKHISFAAESEIYAAGCGRPEGPLTDKGLRRALAAWRFAQKGEGGRSVWQRTM